MWWLWAAYLAGVLIGLVLTDGRPATRIGLALLWPIGPAAFLVVVTILTAAAILAFPLLGAAVAAAGVAGWLWLRM
jgi:hypothetical protein